MAHLLYFKEIQNSNLLRLGISEGEESAAYTVRATVYADIGMPTRGSEISEGAMELVRAEDEYIRCKKRALYLLSIADNNEKSLLSKLRAKGFAYEVASEVCREMVSLGYINEDIQLERIVQREANEHLLGARRIVAKLASKGYSLSRIKAAIERLTASGEVNFSANAIALLERKLPPDATEEERLFLLEKYGFRKS